MKMYFLGIIFYQSFILFASYGYVFGQELIEYELELKEVTVDGVLNAEGTEEKIWQSVTLFKYYYPSQFAFGDDELNLICNGRFPPRDVEILELFGRVIRISLVRETFHRFINLFFTEYDNALLFFGEVRRRQKKDCGKIFQVGVLAQYRILFPEINEDPLQLLDSPVGVYMKNSDSYSDARPKTITFATYKHKTPSDDVYLVLQSKKFNISRSIASDVFILCVENIPTHRFILYFTHGISQNNFFSNSLIENELNSEIPCPFRWATLEILEQVFALKK